MQQMRGAQAPSPATWEDFLRSRDVPGPKAGRLRSIGADDELPYPGTCRNKLATARDYESPAGVSWRFKVPDGETISFEDGYSAVKSSLPAATLLTSCCGGVTIIPAYQLAVVVDDAAMQITEVVRGADLLKSTARQLLLIRALGYPAGIFSLPAAA